MAAGTATLDAARATSIALVEPVPAEAPVGAHVSFKVRVSCADNDDLRGGTIEVVDADSQVATHKLTEYRDGVTTTDVFAITAPDRLGAFTWTVKFPRQEIGGVSYDESALAMSLATQPHRTSLAVWGVPSPVTIGERFQVTVGAKSAAAARLAGATVAIRNESGATVGEGILRDTPWPGTSALYWCEIALTAPSREAVHSFTVDFAARDVALPHSGASTRFSFAAARRPEHRLTVRVSAEGAPVENVQLALGPYRAATDATGIAIIEASAGQFELAAWHAEYEAFSQAVEVAEDGTLAVTLTRLPEQITAWG